MCVCVCSKNPEQLKRLVLLLREEPVPPDAPPVPVESGTEIDGG